ncbi:MAG: O-antigen ligase family protein [Bacteroidota bacterium]
MLKKYFSPVHLFCISLFLALPVCISYQIQDSFVTPRVILIAATVLALSIALIIKARPAHDLLRSTPILALLAFLVLFAISISKSLNPGDAWFEWIKSFLIFPLMLISAILFGSRENRIMLLKFSQVSVLILSAFYCYQWIYFLNNQKLDLVFDLKVHISSTLGNKNFYAEIICLLFPFSCISFFSLEKRWKGLSAFNMLLLIVSLVLTKSIAGLAAFVVAAVLASTAWYFTRPVFKLPGNKVIGILAAIIIIGGVGIFKSGVVSNLNQRVETIQNYIQHPELADSTMRANSNSTFERILLWRNSIGLISENPFTGCGAGNWKLLYPKFGIGGTRYIEGGNVHYEHPHNDYLLIASEAGIPACIAFIIFLVSMGWISFKELKGNRTESLWFAGIIFAATCFLIVSILSFPRMRFYGWILLGIYGGLLFSFHEINTEVDKKNMAARNKLMLLVCALISAWSVTAGISRYTGEVHSKLLQIAKKQKNFPRVVREAEKASSTYFPIDETATPFSWYKGMSYFYSRDILRAKIEYEDALKKNPYHIQLLNDFATACEQTNERERAIELYKRALSVTPNFPHSLLNISACYFNIGIKDSAFIYIDKIYGIRLSGQEKKSYDVYLPAILREKIYMDSAFFKSEIRPQALALATDTGFVNGAYRDSKSTNIGFLETISGIIKRR